MMTRPELGALPARLQRLPVDGRGYPVPWFVAWQNGVPDFRVMDPAKWNLAVTMSRCWVCGEHAGVLKTFAIGPMCAINRVTSEPGSHRECAIWSAQNCPFLSRPHMRRREDESTDALLENVAGTMIDRNPGVALLWTTKRWHVFSDETGKPLIAVGDPSEVLWFCEGRPATRAEVERSIETGLPALQAIADLEDDALRKAKLGPRARLALDLAASRIAHLLPEAV